jgi:uncharacterized protein (DUF305 family)
VSLTPAHHDQFLMPGMMSEDEMTRLRGLRGTSFDLAFVEAMRMHHEARWVQKLGRHAATW